MRHSYVMDAKKLEGARLSRERQHPTHPDGRANFDERGTEYLFSQKLTGMGFAGKSTRGVTTKFAIKKRYKV